MEKEIEKEYETISIDDVISADTSGSSSAAVPPIENVQHVVPGVMDALRAVRTRESSK